MSSAPCTLRTAHCTLYTVHYIRYWMIDENFIEFCCLDKLVERRDAIQVEEASSASK